MRFEKGSVSNKRGRPVGSRDKFRPDVAKMFEKWDFNPLLKLKELYEVSEDENIKLQCVKELSKYYAPQLKAIELSAEERGLFKFTVNIDRKSVID